MVNKCHLYSAEIFISNALKSLQNTLCFNQRKLQKRSVNITVDLNRLKHFVKQIDFIASVLKVHDIL